MKTSWDILRKALVCAGVASIVFLWSSMGLSYDVIDVHHGAMIGGTVEFHGTPPSPLVFEVNKEPDVCGEIRSLTKVDVHQGRLRGAVIILEGVEQGKAFESQTLTAMAPGEGEFRYASGTRLDLNVRLKNCNFGPFTGVVMADQVVQFSNHDPIKHTLHTYVLKGKKANILRTLNTQNLAPQSDLEQTFTPKKLKHGRVVALTCDRHDFMENWMYVVESPYFAISDEAGNFSIDQVPQGQYDLVAWHPVLGSQRQIVNVDENGTLRVNFEFKK
ncbi:carboxypeptidase-like regulatory domain-containing protein [Candidatus Nitronereus thalassa]|uniref:Carboxypeptidase-like regulatory domain-containing protein n=1 Tax=Candidatus Nitronereus thalassa TaxID=3020898 RepID=A0ABU3K3K7_9BACT|nr:carboxypeptidase-like regulatory domain-containing protein [Candidatus Nitronereus thalassa]MDT7040963.1 carboxypeptidase-like regulatory domain-containing protein [Candidatus Nitronereus thalassa]